jgi:hypothetical protein
VTKLQILAIHSSYILEKSCKWGSCNAWQLRSSGENDVREPEDTET